MSWKKWFIVVYVSVLSVHTNRSSAAVEPSTSETISSQPEATGSSMAPIVGYEPSFGFIAGAAYFQKSDRTDWGIDLTTNFKRVYQAHAHLVQELGDSWQYEFRVGGTQGYDPYYGEGGETNVADRMRLWGMRSRNEMRLAFKVSRTIAIGLLGDMRVHTENGLYDSPITRQFPNETSLGVGAEILIDYRDHPNRPTEGFLLRIRATLVPTKWTTVRGGNDFAQLDGALTVYQEILKEAIPNVIAAFRVMGGYTLGHSTYGFGYRLGGSDRLNGYRDNRFRGDRYYLQQTELRFPIYKMVSGAALLGFGDVTNGAFTNPKMSYGMGLRIGLPPDWVSKVRIDLAYGRDEMGVFIDYGQTF